MEKLFLCTFLSYNKLNIINKKGIYITIFFSEFFRCKYTFLYGFNNFVCKLFTCNVENSCIFLIFKNIMGYGVHKMSLAKSYSSIYKKRIPVCTGIFCYRKSGCSNKTVIITNYKSIKCIVGIKICTCSSFSKLVIFSFFIIIGFKFLFRNEFKII